ncbi:MAG: hypothetical protein WCR08_06140 [Gammaproteobacteria bacterium]
MRSVIFDTTLDFKRSFPEIKASFLVLLKKSNIENEVQQEEQKLQILLDLKNKLRYELPENSLSPNRENHRIAPPNIVVNILYRILIIIGLIQQAVGSYLFATTLFSVIPGLSATFLAVISVIYVILDAIIFYAFNASFLKDALHLPRRSNRADTLLDIYSEQLTVTIELNENLSKLSILKMDKERFRDYVELIVLMNQDLRTKNEKMKKCTFSLINKILKYAVIAFGLLSNIASYYYLGITFSAFIAPVVGAFLAQTMILLTIISGLSFYYAIGITGIIRLADPNQGGLDALKKKLTDFSKKYSNDLSDVLFLRDEVESKLMFFKRHTEIPMDISCDQVFSSRNTYQKTANSQYF